MRDDWTITEPGLIALAAALRAVFRVDSVS